VLYVLQNAKFLLMNGIEAKSRRAQEQTAQKGRRAREIDELERQTTVAHDNRRGPAAVEQCNRGSEDNTDTQAAIIWDNRDSKAAVMRDNEQYQTASEQDDRDIRAVVRERSRNKIETTKNGVN